MRGFSTGQFTGVRLGCAGLVIPIDVGQEQAAVDGEHDAIAVVTCGVSDDAGAAFARTLAAGLLLGRHVLAVGGCAQQFARIGQLGLMVFTGLVEPAQPQCLIASLTSLVSLIPHNLRACAVSGAQSCDAFPGLFREVGLGRSD